MLLQGKLADVGVNFKEVLEVRTKNIQASRSRTENFVSSVSAHSQPPLDSQHSASPLYNTPTKSRTPQPGYQNSNPDILNLDPSSSSSALTMNTPQSDQQLLLMEEAQAPNTYINMRGEAIDTIERTINELGSVFSQLAAMVSEQGLVPSHRQSIGVTNDSQRTNPEDRRQHRRRSRERGRCSKRINEILVQGVRQQVAGGKDVWRFNGKSLCYYFQFAKDKTDSMTDFLLTMGLDRWIGGDS